MGRILVVDDEPEIGQILRFVLERRGHTVLVQDGSEGLTTGQGEHPDLILLDLLMPGVDGITMLQRFGADPETAGVPVVVLTAVVTSDMRERCRALGAAAYVTKPFDPFDLAYELERLLTPRRHTDDEGPGHRIRAFRLAAGYSQRDVEALSGIPKPRLSRYETGHVVPSITSLQRIARALDVPPERLLGQGIDLVEVFRLRLKERGVTVTSAGRGRELADLIVNAMAPEGTTRTR